MLLAVTVVAVTAPVEILAEEIPPDVVTLAAVTGPNDAPVAIDKVFAVMPSEVETPPPDVIRFVTLTALAVKLPAELTDPRLAWPAGAENEDAVTPPLEETLPTFAVAALREPVAVAWTKTPVLAVTTPPVLTEATVSVPAAVIDPTAVIEPPVLMLPACNAVEILAAFAVKDPDTAADGEGRVLATLSDAAVTAPVARLPDCISPVTTSAALVTAPGVLTDAEVSEPTTLSPAWSVACCVTVSVPAELRLPAFTAPAKEPIVAVTGPAELKAPAEMTLVIESACAVIPPVAT